ncbi:MAG: hypothetical protein R2795_03095 [Saprospiraceae bacterium]
MKLLSVFYNGNEIAIHNDWWGVETITYNGVEVSRKFSCWGATQRFFIDEEDEKVEYVVKVGFGIWGITANIWRNQVPLLQGLRGKYPRAKNTGVSRSTTHSNASYFHDLV